MTSYSLSATKLVTYKQCPQAYNFRYERGISSRSAFGSADLGNALHQALASAYRDWHYNNHKPGWEWFEFCWGVSISKLSESQIVDGRNILRKYYDDFVLYGCHGEVIMNARIIRVIKSLFGRELLNAQLKAWEKDGSIKILGDCDVLDAAEPCIQILDYVRELKPVK